MSKKKRSNEYDLRELLGPIQPPGSFDDFHLGLHTHYGNVIRRRREVSIDALPFSCEPVAWYSLGARPIHHKKGPTQTLAYAAGDYFVQDAGSLLALALCGADQISEKPLVICDLCAAPGAKASALLEYAEQNQGFLLANEVIGSRIGALTANLSRTGSDRFVVSSQDPLKLAERLGAVFDLVLVDAPCSGQAMLSRGKQSQSAFSKQQVEHSALRQNRILDAATSLVKTGGQLVYSTCTFATDENEKQVERLLNQGIAESVHSNELSNYQTDQGCYRLWPHQHQCAGSFGSKLQITRDQEKTHFRQKRRRIQLPKVNLANWYMDDFSERRLHQTNASLFAWPIDAPGWAEEIAVDGPEVAYRTGQTWKPSHAGALRRKSFQLPRREHALNSQEANAYLQGQTLDLKADGWVTVLYENRPLGWTKVVNGKGKNHLPNHARFNRSLID